MLTDGVSNVVAMGTTCCNGVAMEEGYLCCTTTFADTATKKLGPSHTQCCVSTDTKDVQTFDPKVEVCDTKTGRVQPLPKVPSRLLSPIQSRTKTSSSGKDRKRDRPAARAPPSLPAPVDSERPLATDKNAPPFRYPRLPPKNFFVKDCLENGNEKEDGEDLQCCGSVPYRSSQKTCCKGILHDIPAKDSVCCYETAYRKNDSRNECLKLCGGKPFNTETQACCGGRVRRVKSGVDKCCGDVLINTEKERCCGGMAIDKSVILYFGLSLCSLTLHTHALYFTILHSFFQRCFEKGNYRRQTGKQANKQTTKPVRSMEENLSLYLLLWSTHILSISQRQQCIKAGYRESLDAACLLKI